MTKQLNYAPLQTATLDGTPLSYRLAQPRHMPQGDILFIHGWASSSRMWHELMQSFGKSYRCWALDLPGFGDTPPLRSKHGIDDYVQLIVKFTRWHGIPSAVVVGHSMGGMIALSLAVQYPSLVGSLVAINPVVTGRTYLDLRLLGRSVFSKPMMALSKWFWPLANGNWLDPLFGANKSAAAARIREDWSKASPEASVAALKAMGRAHLAEQLPEITAPTLIVLGTHDLTAPNSEGQLAARQIRGARLAQLPAGHLPTDDLPDKTRLLMEAFLSEARDTAPSALAIQSNGANAAYV